MSSVEIFFASRTKTVFPHIRRIDFALDATGCDASAVDALSTTLTEYTDVLSSTKLNYGVCPLRPFKSKVPPWTQPIQSCPCRLNRAISKQADAVLHSYVAADLITQSTFPWLSPLVCLSRESGGNNSNIQGLRTRGPAPPPVLR